MKSIIWHRWFFFFYLFLFFFLNFTGVSCLQALNSITSHAKAPDTESSRSGKDGLPAAKQQRASADAHSNIFVLRKMVEEVFSVLYSKNAEPVIPRCAEKRGGAGIGLGGRALLCLVFLPDAWRGAVGVSESARKKFRLSSVRSRDLVGRQICGVFQVRLLGRAAWSPCLMSGFRRNPVPC